MRRRSRPFRAGALLLQSLLLLMWSGGSLCLAEPLGHDHAITHSSASMHGDAQGAIADARAYEHLHDVVASVSTHEHSRNVHGPASPSPQANEQTQSPHGSQTPAGCAMMVVCSTPAVAAPELSGPPLALGDRVPQTAEAPLALHSVVNSLEPPPPRA